MLYYELSFEFGDAPYWSLGIDEKRLKQAGGDIWAYSRCELLVNPAPVPCRVAHPGTRTDYEADALTTVPIVSDRLGKLLAEICPDAIQLIPAELDAPGSWWVVNILPLVDSIDYANSLIKFHDMKHPRKPGKPAGILRLIVRREISFPHIFRVKDFTVSVVVSEAIKNRCQDERMINMRFIPATMEEWPIYWQNEQSDRWCYRPWKTGGQSG